MPRALVVDDEPAIRDILSDALESEGYSVEQAENGAAALARVRDRRPDVIVLDLMMPVMDGATFVQTCHAEAVCRDVPIVVLSAAHGLSNRAGDLQPLGVRACLAKPFDLDTLLAIIERYTPPGRAA
jgi:CheY-like chemotaxis protein